MQPSRSGICCDADISTSERGKGKLMRKILLASAAAFVIATPAAATVDNSGYVGIEGGIMKPKSQSVSGTITFTNTAIPTFARTTVASQRYKWGEDIDVIGGYDFGMFRVEGELGYKHAKAKSASVN